VAASAQAAPVPPAAWRAAALAFAGLVDQHYAYPERLPQGRFALTPPLAARAAQVADEAAFTRFAEDGLFLLADHHAITCSARPDSWALVPSFADIWIERRGGHFVAIDVRPGSPAAAAGVAAGHELVAIGGEPLSKAVADFWSALGVDAVDDERAGFAARVLAAGRRDLPRVLGFAGPSGGRELHLPSLYPSKPRETPLVASRRGDRLVIRFQDSLGDTATIAAFDAAMHTARPGEAVTLDLTDTASGGNSTVARAIMGWFTDTPRAFQMHRAIAEERATGIPRQWIEQVLPREGRFHAGPVSVRVGRWTGSMGEGIAIGMAALGADVAGRPMAGLRGAVEDIVAGPDGFTVKLPTERVMAVDGAPREDFVPRALRPGEGD
jgi:hypothetical protein